MSQELEACLKSTSNEITKKFDNIVYPHKRLQSKKIVKMSKKNYKFKSISKQCDVNKPLEKDQETNQLLYSNQSTLNLISSET